VKSVHVLVLTIEWSYYVHGTIAIMNRKNGFALTSAMIYWHQFCVLL